MQSQAVLGMIQLERAGEGFPQPIDPIHELQFRFVEQSETDLLFLARFQDTGDPVLVYLLFEHLHQPSRWFPITLLRYITRIHETYVSENPTIPDLAPVVPIVLPPRQSRGNNGSRFSGSLSGQCPELTDHLATHVAPRTKVTNPDKTRSRAAQFTPAGLDGSSQDRA